MATNDNHNLDQISPTWLANELDDRGVVRLTKAFSPRWLEAMRAMVTDRVAANGDRDFYLDHPDHDIGSPARRLTSDPTVRRLFTDTTGLRRSSPDASADVMRCSMLVLNGATREAPSHLFHYDPCVLTMVVPIFIPRGPLGTCGELVAFGNTRPFRRFQATHVVDKLRTHNTLYRQHTTKRVHRTPEKYVVPLEPGDAYLFWGYRTFHGNLGCAPGQLRTTLVLKFGAVHPTHDWTSKLAWRLSRSRRDMERFEHLPAGLVDAETHRAVAPVGGP